MFFDLWVQILSNRILMQGGIEPNQTIRPLGDVDLETSWYMASLGNGVFSSDVIDELFRRQNIVEGK